MTNTTQTYYASKVKSFFMLIILNLCIDPLLYLILSHPEKMDATMWMCLIVLGLLVVVPSLGFIFLLFQKPAPVIQIDEFGIRLFTGGAGLIKKNVSEIFLPWQEIADIQLAVLKRPSISYLCFNVVSAERFIQMQSHPRAAKILAQMQNGNQFSLLWPPVNISNKKLEKILRDKLKEYQQNNSVK